MSASAAFRACGVASWRSRTKNSSARCAVSAMSPRAVIRVASARQAGRPQPQDPPALADLLNGGVYVSVREARQWAFFVAEPSGRLRPCRVGHLRARRSRAVGISTGRHNLPSYGAERCLLAQALRR